MPATIHAIDGQAWSSFGGFWGESEYFSTPIPLGPLPAGAFPLGVSPASPANQAEWNPQVVLSWPAAVKATHRLHGRADASDLGALLILARVA